MKEAIGRHMHKEENTELEGIIELTDSLRPHAVHKPRGDEGVFATLKAPRTSSGASFMPPYNQSQEYIVDPSLGQDLGTPSQTYDASEDIIELECSDVVHPMGQIHSSAIHADALHVAEVYINTVHSAQSFCDSATIQHGSEEVAKEVCEQSKEYGSVQREKVTPCAHDTVMENKNTEDDNEKKLCQMLQDISTLQTALASIQLRLAAQESCIASLESRLMVSEIKNRELESLCAAKASAEKESMEAQDMAQLEQMTASIAARVVREEIQAITELLARS